MIPARHGKQRPQKRPRLPGKAEIPYRFKVIFHFPGQKNIHIILLGVGGSVKKPSLVLKEYARLGGYPCG